MKIEVLGTGCARCKQTHRLIIKRVKALGGEVSVVQVTDLAIMMAYGVMSTPAVVIDGVVKLSGSVPTAKMIDGWLQSGR